MLILETFIPCSDILQSRPQRAVHEPVYMLNAYTRAYRGLSSCLRTQTRSILTYMWLLSRFAAIFNQTEGYI